MRDNAMICNGNVVSGQMFPNQMRYQAAPLPDEGFPRGKRALGSRFVARSGVTRHRIGTLAVTPSRWGARPFRRDDYGRA